jgi:hypothetical protein
MALSTGSTCPADLGQSYVRCAEPASNFVSPVRADSLTLARGIRLRHDKVRDRWVLLGPERGYVLNDRGRLVVQALVDGAPIDDDALPFVEQLVEKKLVVKK